MTKKIRVLVLYGGKSGEHEVSLQSAASVIRHLDRARFDVIPVSISKTGLWQLGDLRQIDQSNAPALSVPSEAPEVRLDRGALIPIHGGTNPLDIDVVFPVMHGPFCEDGTIQGLLDLAEIAYVGSGVLASAVSMDKDVAKRLAAQAGIPIAPYCALTRKAFTDDRSASLAKAAEGLRLPVFVKPCNMGSSVGVHKVKTWDALGAALDDAFRYAKRLPLPRAASAPAGRVTCPMGWRSPSMANTTGSFTGSIATPVGRTKVPPRLRTLPGPPLPGTARSTPGPRVISPLGQSGPSARAAADAAQRMSIPSALLHIFDIRLLLAVSIELTDNRSRRRSRSTSESRHARQVTVATDQAASGPRTSRRRTRR